MPKVRLKTEAADRSSEPPVLKGPGDIIECDEETAEYIVSQGRGEIVKERPEKATAEAPEKAVQPAPQARKRGKA